MRAELDQSADIMLAEFGTPITYTPAATGTPVEIKAIMTYGAEIIGDSMATERRDLAHVRMADIAQPIPGDTLAVDADTYTIDTYIRSGSLWMLTLLQA